MPDKKKWDMTSINSCADAAKWIRQSSGALIVIVVRSEDWVFSADLGITPGDAANRVTRLLPQMQKMENDRRLAARELALAKHQGGHNA